MSARDLRFCINYVIGFFATLLASLLAGVLFDLRPSAGVIAYFPLFTAAMIEGQRYMRTRSVPPDGADCWIAAVRMTALVTLVYLAVYIPGVATAGMMSNWNGVTGLGYMIAFARYLVPACLILRLGLWVGLHKGARFG